jgi:hypothetical protein
MLGDGTSQSRRRQRFNTEGLQNTTPAPIYSPLCNPDDGAMLMTKQKGALTGPALQSVDVFDVILGHLRG